MKLVKILPPIYCRPDQIFTDKGLSVCAGIFESKRDYILVFLRDFKARTSQYARLEGLRNTLSANMAEGLVRIIKHKVGIT